MLWFRFLLTLDQLRSDSEAMMADRKTMNDSCRGHMIFNTALCKAEGAFRKHDPPQLLYNLNQNWR